jgi:hypothetical protein
MEAFILGMRCWSIWWILEVGVVIFRDGDGRSSREKWGFRFV